MLKDRQIPNISYQLPENTKKIAALSQLLEKKKKKKGKQITY